MAVSTGFGPVKFPVTGERRRPGWATRPLKWLARKDSNLQLSFDSWVTAKWVYQFAYTLIEIWWSVKDLHFRRSQGPALLQRAAIATMRTLQTLTALNLIAEMTSIHYSSVACRLSRAERYRH